MTGRRAAALVAVAGSRGGAAWQRSGGSTANTPAARYGAATTFLQPTGSVGTPLVCGGGDGAGNALDDCAVLAVDSWAWTQVVAPGVTVGRVMHTAALTVPPDFCLQWGGNNATGSVDPDVEEVGAWKPQGALFFNSPNITRYGHSAVMVGAPAYPPAWVIFGGTSTEDGVDLGDMLVLSMSVAPGTAVPPTFTWYPVVAVGTLPSPRKFHSAVVYNNQMYVYGGLAAGVALSDLYVFVLDATLASGRWEYITPTGPTPALYGHRAMVAGSLMVVVGGLTTGSSLPPSASSGGVVAADLSVDTPVWSTPTVIGPAPSTWFLPAVALFTPQGTTAPQLVYFGGGANDAGASPTAATFVLTDIGALHSVS